MHLVEKTLVLHFILFYVPVLVRLGGDRPQRRAPLRVRRHLEATYVYDYDLKTVEACVYVYLDTKEKDPTLQACRYRWTHKRPSNCQLTTFT